MASATTNDIIWGNTPRNPDGSINWDAFVGAVGSTIGKMYYPGSYGLGIGLGGNDWLTASPASANTVPTLVPTISPTDAWNQWKALIIAIAFIFGLGLINNDFATFAKFAGIVIAIGLVLMNFKGQG